MGDASAAWCMNQGSRLLDDRGLSARLTSRGKSGAASATCSPGGRDRERRRSAPRAAGVCTGTWSFASGSPPRDLARRDVPVFQRGRLAGAAPRRQAVGADDAVPPRTGADRRCLAGDGPARHRQRQLHDQGSVRRRCAFRDAGIARGAAGDGDAVPVPGDAALRRRVRVCRTWGSRAPCWMRSSTLAKGKSQAWSSEQLRDNHAVQHIIGYSDAALKAARAGLLQVLDEVWEEVDADRRLTIDNAYRGPRRPRRSRSIRRATWCITCIMRPVRPRFSTTSRSSGGCAT